MKQCTRCKLTKNLNLFYKDKNSKTGYTYKCKVCAKEQRLERYAKYILELNNK